jgi:quercetin dioxygenase-like cupin family protein
MTPSAVARTLVRSRDGSWRALPTPGVSIKVLRSDKATGESTALLRFEPGARFPAHDHPGGEHVFVLEGDLQVGRDRLEAGDYLFTPPHGKHAASSEGGCVFLVSVLKPIEILHEGEVE